MKPLFHPALADITVEGILHALSDPDRARIFREIALSNCAHSCSEFHQLGGRSLPKSTLSQHFKALREAGLIRSERDGVALRNTPRCAEIHQRFGDLLENILAAYGRQCGAPKAKRRAARKPA
jgi:DNA-binding transcriptional ArsR family regulator